MSNGIEEVISTLYEMVQDAWSLPLGADKCVLERDKVLDLLDEINNQLPSEFKQAKTIVDARNEVITNAKREAEAIQKQAEQKARQMVSEQRIYQQAQAEAERLLSDTKAQAEEVVRATQEKLKDLKAVTNDYVLDALRKPSLTPSSRFRLPVSVWKPCPIRMRRSLLPQRKRPSTRISVRWKNKRLTIRRISCMIGPKIDKTLG